MRLWHQDKDGIAALSRWRWTIVVVRQFSLVATSLNHPPAGMWCGVERAALSIPSLTRRIVKPDFVSEFWLFSVIIACSPGPFLLKSAPGGL
jgi:hypothetical protein